MGRYRSLQSIMLAEALKGITDNQTITAYKKDCKLFAAYCKEQGVKRPDQLQGKEKELLQGYEKQLEASGYSPATIHRRLRKEQKLRRYDMDYKKEIIGMIQKIESVRFLAMIYSFTHTLFEKEKNQWGD